MSNAQIHVSLGNVLGNVLEACRRIHESAVHEAEASRTAADPNVCRVSPALLQSFMNVLRQVQNQYSAGFVSSIPAPEYTIHPRLFPVLTAQLLGAVEALAAPMLTPETIQEIWDNPADADYDNL